MRFLSLAPRLTRLSFDHFINCAGIALICTGAIGCSETPAAPSAALTIDAPRLGISAASIEIVDLGTLGGTLSSAIAINSRGQILGSSYDSAEVMHGVIWYRGGITDLGVSQTTFQATDINEKGDLTGISASNHAVLWHDGILTDLGTLGGTLSLGAAINNEGQIAGAAMIADGSRHAFIWENGVMTDLGTLGGATSQALGLSEDGQVVGTSDTSIPGQRRSFIWRKGKKGSPGTMTDLGSLSPDANTRAVGVNTKGQVVGSSNTAGGFIRAVMWQDGAIADLGADPAGNGIASAINEQGRVAGTANFRAFLWEKGRTGVIQLPTLGGSSSSVSDMNAAGQIVGASQTVGGELHAVLWTTR